MRKWLYLKTLPNYKYILRSIVILGHMNINCVLKVKT